MNKLIKKAFTLIELLVVIAIIGILSGIIVVSMSGVTEKANIAKAQVFSNSLKNSLMLSLISEWKLDQILGSSAPYITLDSWSGGNTATLIDTSGACSFSGTLKCPQLITSNCPYGSCLLFDGIDDCIDTNYKILAGPRSYFLWIKFSSITNLKNGFSLTGTQEVGAYTYIGCSNGGQGYWYAGNNGGNFNYMFTTNKWYYIGFTMNLGTIDFYVNGLQVDNKTYSSDTTATKNFRIGCVENNHNINGLIDEVRLYNAAISTSQIKEQYYIGLNKLLINKSISNEEYQNKIAKLATEL
jgi:prepilin-type N-terminal cleavage/methylation domain-containing protein